jgi:hypothetical protein
LLLLAAVTIPAASGLAQSGQPDHRSTGGLVPTDEAARHPMLERLDAFVGEWSTEAPFAPA